MVRKLFQKLVDKRTRERNELIDTFVNAECSATGVLDKLFKLDLESNTVTSPDIYKDIEFWQTVFTKINSCELKGGESYLRQLLSSVNCDIKELESRRDVVRQFEETFTDGAALTELKKNEQAVLSVFEDIDENLKDLFDMSYFKMFLTRKLNNSPGALTGYNIYRILVSPLVGILSPIVYFLVPYLVVIYKFKLNISFVQYLRLTYDTLMNSDELFFGLGGSKKYKFASIASYLFSLLFYFQGLFNSFEISKSIYKISKHLSSKMNQVGEYLRTGCELVGKYYTDEMSKLFGSGLTLAEELAYSKQLCNRKFSLFSNFGKHLYNYKNIQKQVIQSIMHKTYVLDCLASLVRFKSECGVGYTEFVQGGKPRLIVEGLRHVYIKDCVSNDLILGGKQPNNAIITGTNAGGKSVFIKSVLINYILAQTCGLSCCDISVLTPMKYIKSQINMPDATGYESLFECEMHRCKANLDQLKEYQDCSLIVMDEIFSSTNPIEAISGAYAVCKKMSGYERNLLLFTTHFAYLTKLAKTGKFVNYKLETIVEGEDIHFTYKLVPGINKHYLALELLKKNGFDDDIIADALEVKKKLVV